MITITSTLTFQTPFSIASGAQQGTLAQRGFIKDRAGWPYVPASTFKGKLRHAVEQIAPLLPEQTIPVCRTHRDMCRDPVCAVCQIFGSSWNPGQVIFSRFQLSGPSQAVQQKQDGRPLRTSHRTSVSINRRRRVAEDQRLFDIEILWPGLPLSFTGQITGELSHQQAALLVAGIKMLPSIGHSKSRGLGWFESTLEVTENEAPLSIETLRQELGGEA